MAADARRGLPVAEVLERTAAMLASDDVIPVVGAVRNQDVIRRADGVVAPVPTGERRWSTPEMLAVERRLVDSAIRRQQDGVAVVPAGALHETLMSSLARLPSFGADQIEMVAGLAGSGAGVECVEAAPGTGKTTALGVYVAACGRAGIPVIGCAPSAQARDQLRLGARLDRCYTVDRLLIELSRQPLVSGSVVILDEASMAGSRKLGRLLELAAASQAKLVVVGDTKQLSSVDAGGGFRGLIARMGAHELRENRRQVQQWERDALRDLRDGRVRPAMTAYAAHGRLHMGDREELVQRMVDDWWAARSHGEAVMQASSWRDVLELNERARERLVAAGLVEQEGLDVSGVTVGVGDQVIVLRNAYHLGVINGTLGRVAAIDRGELVVQTIEAEPRSVRLPASFWNAKGRRRLALAYCRTIHKAQGATYQGASFTLAGDDTIHLEAVHVALSRGTEANHLYYMGEPLPDEDHQVVEVSKPGHERLVAAAARSRAQVMALDLLTGVSDARVSAAAGSEGADAPMTEAQVRVLARHGALPERHLTWVQASLLIDDAIHAPRGGQAMIWLQENGVTAENAANIIALAERDLRNPSQVGADDAVVTRLEQLELALRAGRHMSRGESQELYSLRRHQADATDRRRQRRRAWARSSAAAAPPATSAASAARASPRIAR